MISAKTSCPRMIIENMRVFAYPYGGYWIDVGTLDAYWEAHMDLLQTSALTQSE